MGASGGVRRQGAFGGTRCRSGGGWGGRGQAGGGRVGRKLPILEIPRGVILGLTTEHRRRLRRGGTWSGAETMKRPKRRHARPKRLPRGSRWSDRAPSELPRNVLRFPAVGTFVVRDVAQCRDRIDDLRARLSPPSERGVYRAYVDGACKPNPGGRGGWGAVVMGGDGEGGSWELWGHLSRTTNQRAEALALLAVVAWVPPDASVDVLTDSWSTKHVFDDGSRPPSTWDIWVAIRRVVRDKRLAVRVAWVRGHAGNPGNERADALSVLGVVDGEMTAWARRRMDTATHPELAGLDPRTRKEYAQYRKAARRLRSGRSLTPPQRAFVRRLRERARQAAPAA